MNMTAALFAGAGLTVLLAVAVGCSTDEAEPAAAVATKRAVTAVAEAPTPSLPPAGALPQAASATPANGVSPERPQAAGELAQRQAEQHEVRGVVTQWRPMVLFIEPGDTVVFRQMTGHDTQAMEGLFPAAATAWSSKMGQEGYSITLTEPGAYLYKCNPHVSSGMIGAIIVGQGPPANLAAIEASAQNKGMTGRAIRKLKQALEQRG